MEIVVLVVEISSVPRLDYLALHRTGTMVIKINDNEGYGKVCNINVLSLLKTLEDLEFDLDLFEDIEDYEFKSEVKEAITSVSALLQEYRQVNVDIKLELGPEEFLRQYPNYEENVGRATAFLKRAQKYSKQAKNDLIKIDDDQREPLKTEQEVLEMKINQICKAIDIQNEDDVAEIESFVRNAEIFVSEYFELCGKSKRLFAEDHDEEKFQSEIDKINDKIKVAKSARKKLLDIKAKHEVEVSKGGIKNDHFLRGQNLAVEIKQRLEQLEIKFDQDLDSLGDYQILEISQNKMIESDFNTVLEKITDLAGLVYGGGADVEELL